MMKKVPALCFSDYTDRILFSLGNQNTTATNANTTTAEKTLPYGDNPSLGRVCAV